HVRGELQRFAIDCQYLVPILETIFLKLIGYSKTIGHIFRSNAYASPDEEDHHIDKESEDQVHCHSPKHNNKALPGRFASDFPFLRRLGHLLAIHALIDHTSDFDIPPKWKPAHPIHSVTDLLLKNGELHIEEQEELLHLHLKYFGRDKVT